MLDEQTKKLADDLYQFLKKRLKFDRDPKITFIFDEDNAKDALAKTGHYDPDSEEVVVYAAGRHPKDILRSLAHELYHHFQKCNGELTPDKAAPEGDPNYIIHDKFLEKIEVDAFGKGNKEFRFWEAEKKMNNKDLNEGKKKKKKHTKKQINKVHRAAGKMEKEKGYLTEKAFKIAWSKLGESKEDNMSKETDKTVTSNQTEVNEALKDSVVYQTGDRSCNDLYNNREETVFQDLLKKFGIKKQNG